MLRRTSGLIVISALLLIVAFGAASPGIGLVLNGKTVRPDVSPVIIGDRTMVPVRMISELLGAKVEWLPGDRIVDIKGVKTGNLQKQADLLAAVVLPGTPVDAATMWAEGALTSNGALQYAALSVELRNKMLPAYKVSGWITGWPGGWADSYEVTDETSGSDISPRKIAVTFVGAGATGGTASEKVTLDVRLARRQDGSAVWSVNEVVTAKASIVPLIEYVGAPNPTGGPLRSFAWSTMTWDLNSGKIAPVAGLVATMKASNQRIAWDGTKSITLVPGEPEDKYSVEETRSEYAVRVAETPGRPGFLVHGWLVDALDADKEVLATCQLNIATEPKIVDIKAYTLSGTRSIPFDIGDAGNSSLLRPVALYGSLDQPKVIFETWWPDSSGMRCGLIEATRTDRGITWRTISDNLGIFEAGAGTSMMKAGNFIYIGIQGGDLKKVDISTGAIVDCVAVNEAIRAFNTLHGYEIEAAVPPTVSVYGDTLLVNWTPPTTLMVQTPSGVGIEPIMARLYLAVRDDKVVSEIRDMDGEITLHKNGIVTGRMTNDPSIERGFLFPSK